MIIKDLLKFSIQELSSTSPSPRLDAELLLTFTLDLTRTQLLINENLPLSEEQQKIILKNLARRKKGEPIAYILGHQEFWSLDFKVTTDTLIPRPETELLVELALQKFSAEDPISVADLGTGCGAIALAIAYERPSWKVIATDFSASALDVARKNAEDLAVKNISFRQGDWYEAFNKERFDLIVSNPPYVAESDPHLGNLRFEPQSALQAGPDGLRDLTILIAGAGNYLESKGWLMVEHGYDQGQCVRDIFLTNNFLDIMTVKDFAQLERVTFGRRKN